ncbi:MAG: hypothetical protein AB8C13_02830 [Phycisphaerales bacterium]
MRNDRLHLIAAGFFACAFVLAGSGWSSVLSSLIDQRPSWSLCGQDMCSCSKPTAAQPACPLCEAGLMDPADMLTDQMISEDGCTPRSIAPVQRVPKNRVQLNAVTDAGSTACVAMFIGMMLKGQRSDLILDINNTSMMIVNDRLPAFGALDSPTPPPRA